MQPYDESRFFQREDGSWYYLNTAGAHANVTPRECEFCGEEFLPRPAHPTTHCSRTCAAKCKQTDRHIAVQLRGSGAPRWKGGRIKRRGYVHIWMPDHHSIAGRGTTRKYVLEHRVVMEQKLGRNLEPHEKVHHINGVTDDNRPDNLELWLIRGQPSGQREGEGAHCPTCTCGHAQ